MTSTPVPTHTENSKLRVAAFDVDGTLTAADCVVPFLRRTVGTPTLVRRMLRSPLGLTRAGLRRDRDALKAASAAATFRGLPIELVRADAEVFAREVHDRRLRREVVQSLHGHLEAGDTVLLVSASFEVYLQPLAKLLGAHDVLAVRLEVDDDGILTGGLEGLNCRGPEKVVRLHDWLDRHAGGRAAVHLSAYGDSRGDRELLADADEAHWLGRGAMPGAMPGGTPGVMPR
ncbi:MAG TPA: HAD-IB family hydrolase [Ilumatobacteraceae bacterium]|nr:HAD-IB family hydrolase [Ilumatobacteraceae bacterium]